MEIIIIILLILLNGLFAMSEIALISARRSNLTARAKQGNKAAAKALQLAQDPDRFLSTIQIGITLIGILTGIYSGEALAGRFGAMLASLGMPLRTGRSGRPDTYRHRRNLPHDRLRRAGAQTHRHEKRRTGRHTRRTADAGARQGDVALRMAAFAQHRAYHPPARNTGYGEQGHRGGDQVDHSGGNRRRRGADRRTADRRPRILARRPQGGFDHDAPQRNRMDRPRHDARRDPRAGRQGTPHALPRRPQQPRPAGRRDIPQGPLHAHRRGGFRRRIHTASGKILPRGDPSVHRSWNNSAANRSATASSATNSA